MAPSKKESNVVYNNLKFEVFENVKNVGVVPKSYISLKEAERQYNVTIQVILICKRGFKNRIFHGGGLKARSFFYNPVLLFLGHGRLWDS